MCVMVPGTRFYEYSCCGCHGVFSPWGLEPDYPQASSVVRLLHGKSIQDLIGALPDVICMITVDVGKKRETAYGYKLDVLSASVGSTLHR